MRAVSWSVASVVLVVWAAALSPGEEPSSAKKPAAGKIVEQFYQALAEKQLEQALALVQDSEAKKEFSKRMEELLKEGALGRKTIVLDEKIVGDVAVVIIGTEGNFRTGLDIDPTFLLQVDGQWKIVPALVADEGARAIITAAKDKEQAEKSLRELAMWYGMRKREIYAEREKQAKGNK